MCKCNGNCIVQKLYSTVQYRNFTVQYSTEIVQFTLYSVYLDVQFVAES